MEKKNVTVNYKDVEYNVVFNLNVMEQLQETYGSISAWADLTEKEEPDAKAVIVGLMFMLNEGIEIDNEDNEGVDGYTPKKELTTKQVGRLLTEVGLAEVKEKMHDTVINSTKTDEKN